MDLENFERVWQRVTAQDDTVPEPEAPKENAPKLCAARPQVKSRAVRFLAGL